jgi:hypothetical protein
MKNLGQIRKQLSDGEFEFTSHALRRSVERNISEQEIRQVGKNAQVVENYPDDKYTPSCLLLGFTKTKRPLHDTGIIRRYRNGQDYYTLRA